MTKRTETKLEKLIRSGGPEGLPAHRCDCAIVGSNHGGKARTAALELLAEMGLIFRIIPKDFRTRGHARWVHSEFND